MRGPGIGGASEKLAAIGLTSFAALANPKGFENVCADRELNPDLKLGKLTYEPLYYPRL